MNDRFWELLGKYWSDQINSEEKAELEQLLLNHPDHWLKTGMIDQLDWKLNPVLSEEQLDKITQRVINRRKNFLGGKRKPERKKIVLWQLAAAVFIVLFAGFWIARWEIHKPKDGLVWKEAATTNGMRTKLRLADGTELWLNTGSVLRYPDNFNNKAREVYLSGEAYFEVVHNPARPFIIHTQNMDVKVLGTVLDVRAYKDEDWSTTTLISGAVEVALRKNEQKKIMLRPHQKIEIHKDAVELKGTSYQMANASLDSVALDKGVVLAPVAVKDNVIPEVAWKQNIFLFDNETLQSLTRRLEKWYGVSIIIEDSTLAQERFTGRADNISLEKLLGILQLLKPFHYEMHDKDIVIKK